MATTVVLAVLTVATLVATVWVVVVERRPGQPTLAEGSRAPLPAWWAPVLGVGLVDLVVGAAASTVMALVGVLLVAGALVGLGRALLRPRPVPGRRLVALARRVRRACGPDPHLTSLRVGAARVRLVCRGTGPVGSAGYVDDVVRDLDEVATVAALVGARPA